ncbi:hypothetical protein GDO81_028507 [Engystomops pustulosus]|uniref:Uncharacterized protein n=1 Tax=Engystomops pustulosus TaxID=76066 RepID=A0AAV6YD46_ENGPU|nr:hypothetical protein GDO81_028507 [Engystomops pustulosus]
MLRRPEGNVHCLYILRGVRLLTSNPLYHRTAPHGTCRGSTCNNTETNIYTYTTSLHGYRDLFITQLKNIFHDFFLLQGDFSIAVLFSSCVSHF